MLPRLKPFLYGLGVFVIYILLVLALRQVTNHVPTDYEYFGLFSKKDILLGLVLAIILTFTHIQKKKLK
ncbi:MAG: hypothetical protein Q8904_10265 [Bacteroidota bacterium]|nr:hypothetical protein [Bacteroidota bacterium]